MAPDEKARQVMPEGRTYYGTVPVYAKQKPIVVSHALTKRNVDVNHRLCGCRYLAVKHFAETKLRPFTIYIGLWVAVRDSRPNRGSGLEPPSPPLLTG